MPCNCPNSGCQCAESSSTSVAVSGTGSSTNPYVHTAVISPTVGNQVSIAADGLLVPAWDPCDHLVPQSTVANGNVLIENALTCGIDRLVDPPLNNFLGHDLATGNAAWKPLASSDAGNQATIGSDGGIYVPPGSGTIDPCDVSDVGTIQTQGNLLIQGGVDCRFERLISPTSCQVLGNVGGQAGWVNPNIIQSANYSQPIQFSILGNPVAVAGAGNQSTFANFASIANPDTCANIVMVQLTGRISALPIVANTDNIFQQTVTVGANRGIGGAVIAYTNNRDFISQIHNFRGTGNTTGPVSTFGTIIIWLKLAAGDTATLTMQHDANNIAGMNPNAFDATIENMYTVRWRV